MRTTNQLVMPADDNSRGIALPPASVALAVTKNDAVSTSTLVAVSLNASTSFIEVTALDSGIYLKYASTGATSTVFDEYVPAGMVRHYVIPQGVNAISFIADEGTSRVRVIEK